jgi:hypothetical protein
MPLTAEEQRDLERLRVEFKSAPDTPAPPTSTETSQVLPMSPMQAAGSFFRGEQRLTAPEQPPGTVRATIEDPAQLAQRASQEYEQTDAGKLLKRLGTEAALVSAGGPVFGMAPRGFQMLGRMANAGLATMGAQQLGVAPEGPETQMESALSVPITEGGLAVAKRAAQPILRRLPGAAAGQHEAVAEEVTETLQGLRVDNLPAMRASVASIGNLYVPLQNFERQVVQLMGQEQGLPQRLRAPRLLPMAQDLWTELQGTLSAIGQPGMSLAQVRERLDRIGSMVGDLRRAQGAGGGSTPLYQGVRSLYRTLLDDLDSLPGAVPRQLMALRRGMRQDLGAQDLEHLLTPHMQQRNVDGLVMVNGRAMVAALQRGRDAQFIRESIPAADLREIEALLARARALPALPTPQGVAAGSSITLGRTVGGTAGGYLLGPLFGMDPQKGAAAGGAIGALGPRVLARALMTRPGRAFVRTVLAETPYFTQQDLQYLAILGRSVNDQ